MTPPNVARPSRSYIEGRRRDQGLRCGEGRTREPLPSPAAGNTPLGLPICLVPNRTGLGLESLFGWHTLPSQGDLRHASLQPYEWRSIPPPPGATFVQGSGRDMALAMYRATAVPGVSEEVPAKLRGVFWMKGNGVPEELAALQYGRWDASECTLLTPVAPLSWGWPDGRPAGAPFNGNLYSNSMAEGMAHTMLNDAGTTFDSTSVTMAARFDATPIDGSKSSARLEAFVGDPRVNILNGWGYGFYGTRHGGLLGRLRPLWRCCAPCSWPVSQSYSLEEVREGNPALDGSAWRRGVRWGCCGLTCIPFGGYTLLKVVEGDGTLTAHFDEWVEYIGSVPIWSWVGSTGDGG